MNKRHREIIICIKGCQKYNRKCTLRMLIDHFHVSERTIRYDLDEILRFFAQKNLPSLRIDDDGNIVLLANEADIQNVLQSNDFYSFKLNKKERAQMIIYFLLETTDSMTLQELADILLVSRSTVIHDVNLARKIAINYDLEIVSLSKGIRIVGKESNSRILLMNLINEMNSLDYYYGQKGMPFSNMDAHIFSQIIQDNESAYKMFLTDQSFSELLTYLRIMINKINHGRYVEIDYVLQHPSTALIAGSILDAIADSFGIQTSLPGRYLLSDLLYNFKYI